MNVQDRLAIAAVRVAALRALASAGGEPRIEQLHRAAAPLLVQLRARAARSSGGLRGKAPPGRRRDRVDSEL